MISINKCIVINAINLIFLAFGKTFSEGFISSKAGRVAMDRRVYVESVYHFKLCVLHVPIDK